ncbi:MAG: RNA polymerase sigma-70 factor [Ginsengibacter sp.]
MYINTSHEKDLVVLLRDSSEAAFEELYHLYSNRLLGYLIKLVKSEGIASELLQDFFIKIWNNRQNIDPEKSFRSYLFCVAENLVYDFFRKAARNKKLEAVLINNSCGEYRHIEENFCRKENIQLLQNAIDALPPKRRQVFQLVKMEERSYEEVSSILHVSVSTINDHIVKATKSIREKLEPYQLTKISIIIVFLLS